jgi:hypothetical protein
VQMGIKTRFDRFASKIRPTDDHIKEANRQTDYMVEKLKDRVSADGSFRLVKVLKAGSNAKFTSLRRTTENIFDVDLGAYYSGTGATKEKLGDLLQFTRDQLASIYPTKSSQDFEVKKSAVRVIFQGGIKLNVDVAPIIHDDSLHIENGGWIPRSDGWRLTSVTCHNQFVRSRTTQSNSVSGPVKFNRLVRMIKWWNNRQGDLVQPSIFCDCITAAAFAEVGVTSEWQTSLRHVFNFLRQHQFQTPIVFSDYYAADKVALPDDPVVVLDSVNASNNITGTWTEETRQGYLERIQEAFDAMTYARSCELDGDEEGAVNCWCDVFGSAFRTLSEEEE